jgi:hypothetical protein
MGCCCTSAIGWVCTRRWPAPGRSPSPRWRNGPAPPSDTSVEWLGNQAAGGHVAYNLADSTYELPAEQAMVVANEDSPVFLGGAFETIASCYADHDVFVDAFRTGAGVGWQDHDDRLFSGGVRFFRPGYAAHLAGEWLPALEGVVEKLRAGASVADVGVRNRCVHSHHGAGVRALDVRGLRHP